MRHLACSSSFGVDDVDDDDDEDDHDDDVCIDELRVGERKRKRERKREALRDVEGGGAEVRSVAKRKNLPQKSTTESNDCIDDECVMMN